MICGKIDVAERMACNQPPYHLPPCVFVPLEWLENAGIQLSDIERGTDGRPR